MPPGSPRRRRHGRLSEPAEPFDPGETGSDRRPPGARPELADESDPDDLPPQFLAVAGGDAGAIRILLALDAESGVSTAGDADAAYGALPLEDRPAATATQSIKYGG